MKNNVIVLEKTESQLTDSKAVLQARIDKARQIVGTLKVDFVLLPSALTGIRLVSLFLYFLWLCLHLYPFSLGNFDTSLLIY